MSIRWSTSPKSAPEKLRHFKSLFLFGSLLFLFFFPVVLGQKGFYAGDLQAQHYPWWVFLCRQIRQGTLPVWTSQIASGFPLLAEGQIGAFYPFNLLFAFLFPPSFGYNACILFHFFLGGIIFYFYGLALGLSRRGAFFATLLYVFGTARAGSYYNITSQRVLIWFPLALYFLERLFKKARPITVFYLSLTLFLQIIAGYQQFALYACLFIVVYAFLRFLSPIAEYSRTPQKLKFTALVLFSFFLGIVFSLPQILPFMQLFRFSSRIGLPDQFAYVGSTNPLGLIALFYPDWDDFFHCELYVGILSLFFVMLLFFSRKTNLEKAILWLALISFALAVGGYNPLFVLFVKLTHYGGRVPSKFLYFTSTFLALLAGLGLDRFFSWEEKRRDELEHSKKCFVATCASVIGIMLGASLFLRVFRPPLLPLSRFLVDRLVLGNPVHPHSPEIYYEKALLFYEALLKRITPFNFYTSLFTIFILLAIFLVPRIIRMRKQPQLAYLIILIVVSSDLFAYAQNGVLGNLRRTDLVEKSSKIIETLKNDRSFFRTYVFTEDGIYDDYPLYPNLNMAYGLNDIGGYSPLLLRKYSDYLEPLGGINNSLLVSRGTLGGLQKYFYRLNFLSVKYLLSLKPLPLKSLSLLTTEKGVYLYENHEFLGGAYWLSRDQVHGAQGHPVFDERTLNSETQRYVTAKNFAEDHLLVEINSPQEGYLVIPYIFYPGWTVRVDGERAQLLNFNDLFMGVALGPGPHQVLFQFSYLEGLKAFFKKR